ncbi:alpha/beta hydrolase [Nostocoides japonicum]|uniref:alpha/beta hydrolase n=1 Tax=Nostocoides japonicum TaxID=99481 RepID=UPI00190FD57B|nr:alpha/beta hydrolase [Tetrasphaera japonica]
MVGYLVSVVILAVPTALALAPMRGSWTRGQLSWRLGFQINELPFVAAAWLLASTALAIWDGNLATPVGATAAGLATSVLAGLTLIAVRGAHAGRAISEALEGGLGADWPSHLSPELARGLRRRRPWLRIVVAPLGLRRRDVVHERNLGYGPEGRQNLLDCYRPRGATKGPCLVYFHGGGYRSGAKNREARALLYRLASEGWLCVSANYRYGPGARWPDQLVDAHRAIAWTRTTASEHGHSDADVFVAGSSAGAHLASMAALTARYEPGRPDTRVAGAICLYGFYGTPNWIDRDPTAPCAPIDLIDSDTVPFFIAHGTLDSFVPVSEARRFVERLRRTSRQPVVYAELPGGQHTFDLYRSMRFEAVVDGIEAATAWIRSSHASPPPARPD